MIDSQGFRLNVGIVLANHQKQLFWGRRVGRQEAWQFPQGGIQENESLLQAMYRELAEEVGLTPDDVEVISMTRDWLYYRLPSHLRRYSTRPLCIGQKQKWFLLKLIGAEHTIQLDATPSPEFDTWQWVEYWYPLKQVIAFKKNVYHQVLTEFEPFLFTSPAS